MKFNVNDTIKVKLRDAGKEVLRKNVEQNLLPGKDVDKLVITLFPTADDGYTEFVFWEFMNIFGPVSVIGVPFDYYDPEFILIPKK